MRTTSTSGGPSGGRSDYRTLYVAHVAEITADDPRKDPAERAHIPAYYLADGRVADFWFRLWDIRRLVQDDTESVIHDLQQLRNVRYEDKPVSIYGGMVDLPLIVTEPEPVLYFDEATRAQVTGGAYWVEFEAGQAGGGRLARDLRQNLFGDEAWHWLDPATRTFVVTAERIFLGPRGRPGVRPRAGAGRAVQSARGDLRAGPEAVAGEGA